MPLRRRIATALLLSALRCRVASSLSSLVCAHVCHEISFGVSYMRWSKLVTAKPIVIYPNSGETDNADLKE
ncbi:hypothetical protein D0Y65_041481 [Glycine soja]|uniref:Secreted protein n=1 Tax=Glycine soja TaxID=3848 RepID=A0A445GW09_GLYSO|nr:hypothetical protein D0Y65_041481 [Glycine soja]RZB65439.1 hypothetical protein D0Y65_041481 [Glycine soja]